MAESGELGIVLVAGDYPRVHAAFLLAAGAAALGRQVVLFATGAGVRALCTDWTGLGQAEQDAGLQARGVAGLDALRDACIELGVQMIACDSGVRGENVTRESMLPRVTCAGMAYFLEQTKHAQLVAF